MLSATSVVQARAASDSGTRAGRSQQSDRGDLMARRTEVVTSRSRGRSGQDYNSYVALVPLSPTADKFLTISATHVFYSESTLSVSNRTARSSNRTSVLAAHPSHFNLIAAICDDAMPHGRQSICFRIFFDHWKEKNEKRSCKQGAVTIYIGLRISLVCSWRNVLQIEFTKQNSTKTTTCYSVQSNVGN